MLRNGTTGCATERWLHISAKHIHLQLPVPFPDDDEQEEDGNHSSEPGGENDDLPAIHLESVVQKHPQQGEVYRVY